VLLLNLTQKHKLPRRSTAFIRSDAVAAYILLLLGQYTNKNISYLSVALLSSAVVLWLHSTLLRHPSAAVRW
jgi:hypothetical protein